MHLDFIMELLGKQFLPFKGNMAIQKTKTLANGVTGNYWKITQVSVDKQSMTATATIALFTDAAHTNTSPITGTNKQYKMPVTKAQLTGDITAAAYTSIKAQASTFTNGKDKDPDLAGGTDA